MIITNEEMKEMKLDPKAMEKLFMDLCWTAMRNEVNPGLIIGVLEVCKMSVKHSVTSMWSAQLSGHLDSGR